MRPNATRATNAHILAWAEARPWACAMASCQQDAQWHAEGDVWAHTRMVCAQLERLADWLSLDRAALFHDAGKSELPSAATRSALDDLLVRVRLAGVAPTGRRGPT